MKMKKKISIFSEIGLVISALCSAYGVLSIVNFKDDLESTSFGGDFYTYIYKAVFEVYQKVTLNTGIVLVCLTCWPSATLGIIFTNMNPSIL